MDWALLLVPCDRVEFLLLRAWMSIVLWYRAFVCACGSRWLLSPSSAPLVIVIFALGGTGVLTVRVVVPSQMDRRRYKTHTSMESGLLYHTG